MRLLVAAFAITTLTPALAAAGPFTGIAPDGRYVVGGERICQPVAVGGEGAPTCEKISPGDLAKLTLERPKKEQGTRARFSAKSSGTKLMITAAGESKPSIRWDSGSLAGKIAAVYADKAGTVVVLEYESRFGGRMVTEVAGFRVAASTTDTRPDVKPDSKPDAPVGPTLSDDDQKKYDKHLVNAWKQLKRKRWAKAASAASSALTLWDQSAEALAVLASAKAELKDKEAALATLEKLAVSKDPAAPEYRVEARTAKSFASLRADPRFRRAVGITLDPDRPLSAYERVMGFGGKWEQRLIACEQPEVKLTLKRAKKRFSLRIKSRCGGSETTYLDGTWVASGTDALKLTFPNQGADDEGMVCLIERCRDSSGEDCVRCRVDDDLEFLLRLIRR